MNVWRLHIALMASAVAAIAPLALAAGAAPPLGLPPLPLPADNPLTAEKIELGRMLFMDRRLSHNDTLSCAMCHVPEQGYTSNELATSVGIEGQTVRRNAPTILNVAYVERLFHDGRETSLENQVWGPLLAGNEMGNPSIGYVIEKIRSLAEYRGRFEAAFAGAGPSMLTIGQALAAYERTVLAANSRFDRWRYGGEANALDAVEQAGFRLFAGKAGCGACHLVGSEHALFSDGLFHNTGIGYAASMGAAQTRRVQLAPNVFVEIEDSALDAFETKPADVGRYEVTLDPADAWAYRTPSLRNVALTAPYMHDGSLSNLAAVIEFYDRGGIDNPNKSPLLKPLGLSADEKRALVAFLKSLTGEGTTRLAAQARGATTETNRLRE